MAQPEIIKDINDQVSAVDPNGDTMAGNLSILFGDTDKFINWRYSKSTLGGSWRIGALGSGVGDANYFVIQSTTAATGSSETWTNILKIGQNSFNISIDTTTNSTSTTTGSVVLAGGLGVAKDIYAANFIGNFKGNLNGNATTADYFKINNITSGADLNNLTPYLYADGNTSICSTLVNKPSDMPNGEISINTIPLSYNSYIYSVQTIVASNSASNLEIYIRKYHNGTFGDWKKLLTSSNYSGYALPLTGGTLTGNLTAPKFIGALQGNADTATKATQDGDGAVISSTYLKLSGGTMTGTIFHTNENTGKRIIAGNLRNSGIKYDYSGRESLIISAGTYANAGISFYTANELNMNDGNGQWNTVSPSVHILKKSLAINYNLTEDPTYNLYVNGTSYFAGTIIATMFKGDSSAAGIRPCQSNEINFSSNGGTIWFGYRTLGDNPVSVYNFGNSAGSATGRINAGTVYGAVWNDYAEYRSSDPIEPGRVICETGNGTLKLSTERLQPGASVVSDTFGFAIGETENCKTPIAVSGRALVYTYEDRYSYAAGDPVCAGPGGTISKMSREEVMMYPDRIVGTVSEIPEYERWGTGNVEVKNRIWIKVK